MNLFRRYGAAGLGWMMLGALGCDDGALSPRDSGRTMDVPIDTRALDTSPSDVPGSDVPGLDAPTLELDASLPTMETACGDGVDNDGDSFTDCADADCASAPSCIGTCPVVPVPAEVSDAPLPSEPGTFDSVSGAFHDDYLIHGSGSIKIGVRREWGGSIVFFGLHDGHSGSNATNVIDANDTGREVQVAFYDGDRIRQGCAVTASCASAIGPCPASITYLGWNPVQGGNRCNNGSSVESVDTSDNTLTVTTRPLFWNPNWDRSDCSDVACSDPALRARRSDVSVTQSLRFVRQHVVELTYAVTNLSSLAHGPTHHEFPTVYTANGRAGTADLYRLFDSAGTEIGITTPANDGFFVANFTSPDGWVTMQNGTLDYGVGLYNETRASMWQGWQNRGLPFNNFRPLLTFPIPASATIRGRSYLVIGSLDTVRSESAWLDTHLPAFGVLDAPAADAVLSGSVAVQGWALDNRGVARMELRVDGGAPITLSYGAARPDVCAVWPGYAECSAVGYSGTLDVTGLSACAHLLEVTAVDSDGNARVIARRRVVVGS